MAGSVYIVARQPIGLPIMRSVGLPDAIVLDNLWYSAIGLCNDLASVRGTTNDCFPIV